jgi:hypothetical protein
MRPLRSALKPQRHPVSSFFIFIYNIVYYKQQSNTIMAGAVRRLIFTNQRPGNNNHYVPGSGVGGLNISVRRHLKRFATSPQGANGMYSPAGKTPCCPELLQNYGNYRMGSN